MMGFILEEREATLQTGRDSCKKWKVERRKQQEEDVMGVGCD